jgi:hypothetical protein
MKIEWQNVIESGTVSGELLQAPQMMRACSSICICNMLVVSLTVACFHTYVGIRGTGHIADREFRAGFVDEQENAGEVVEAE